MQYVGFVPPQPLSCTTIIIPVDLQQPRGTAISRLPAVVAVFVVAAEMACSVAVVRTRNTLLLLLATWLGGCSAAGTICSREPTVCDGTHSESFLCALSLPAGAARAEGRTVLQG